VCVARDHTKGLIYARQAFCHSHLQPVNIPCGKEKVVLFQHWEKTSQQNILKLLWGQSRDGGEDEANLKFEKLRHN
jgi:hypothetical protein